MKFIVCFLFSIGVLFPATRIYSQSPGGISSPLLWIKQQGDFNEKKTDTSNYYNFNPKYSVSERTSKEYKNKLSNRYSLFVVFKSDEKEETRLATLKLGDQVTSISNKKVETDKSLDYKKVHAKNGIILSYFVSQQNPGKKNPNSLLLENLKSLTHKTAGHDLMELLYYPKVLNALERKKVESYLSIKYGISLLGNPDYIDSDQHKIWDAEKNAGFNNRVTGIGKDKASGLEQKQSGNAEKNGLYIGYGSIDSTNLSNKTPLTDKMFLVWGDNGGSTSLKKNKDETGIRKMKRIWKTQNTPQDAIPTTLLIRKKEMQTNEQVDDQDLVWLAIASDNSGDFDYTNARYILPTTTKDDALYFKNIIWDTDKSGGDFFTFIKAPAFFAVYDITGPNCNIAQNGTMKVKINGGQAPFSIQLQSAVYTKNFTTNQDMLTLNDLPNGDYTVRIADSNGKLQTDHIAIESITETALSIASEWYLDANHQAELIPITTDQQLYTYEWYFNNSVKSTEKNYTATETGDYTLLVKNPEGCTKEFLLKVKAKNDDVNGNLVLYPNPIQAGQTFTLRFDLQKASDAEIRIFDLNGRLLRSKNLYAIQSTTYQDVLSTTGTYLIVVNLNETSKVIKLIVQ